MSALGHLLPPRWQDQNGQAEVLVLLQSRWRSRRCDPRGVQVYENPDARVYIRKKPPQIVTPEEVAVVKQGVQRLAPGQNCLVDVRKADIIVYHSKRGNIYQKTLRFTLDDKKDRAFRVERWCSRGQSTAGSISGCREVSGNYRFWSRRSAHTSVKIPSTT